MWPTDEWIDIVVVEYMPSRQSATTTEPLMWLCNSKRTTQLQVTEVERLVVVVVGGGGGWIWKRLINRRNAGESCTRRSQSQWRTSSSSRRREVNALRAAAAAHSSAVQCSSWLACWSVSSQPLNPREPVLTVTSQHRRVMHMYSSCNGAHHIHNHCASDLETTYVFWKKSF